MCNTCVWTYEHNATEETSTCVNIGPRSTCLRLDQATLYQLLVYHSPEVARTVIVQCLIPPLHILGAMELVSAVAVVHVIPKVIVGHDHGLDLAQFRARDTVTWIPATDGPALNEMVPVDIALVL